MEKVIQVNDADYFYTQGAARVPALRHIDLGVGAGEFVALVGASGSGKTTLLNLLSCIDVPSRGSVRVRGTLTFHLREKDLSQLRRQYFGFIFQQFNLLSYMSVERNVALPLQLLGVGRAERRARVNAMLTRVGLASYAKRRPSELSGGQQQRVAIARALVHRPALILADEPTANLDGQTGREVLSLLRELQQADGTAVVVATHDHRVLAFSQRVARMADGRIVEESRPCESSAQ